MIDLLLPRTDVGVAVQFLLVLAVGAGAIAAVWRRRHLRIFAIGSTVLLLALMSVRALH